MVKINNFKAVDHRFTWIPSCPELIVCLKILHFIFLLKYLINTKSQKFSLSFSLSVISTLHLGSFFIISPAPPSSLIIEDSFIPFNSLVFFFLSSRGTKLTAHINELILTIIIVTGCLFTDEKWYNDKWSFWFHCHLFTTLNQRLGTYICIDQCFYTKL